MNNKSIYLSDEQIKFIDESSRFFNFSKFVRDKLDEYIKSLKEYRRFIEIK